MKKIFICICLLFIPSCFALKKLTIVFIIDSFSYNTFTKTKDHLTGGIASLIQQSTSYEQAYFQYPGTSTSAGSTTLSTGCWPSKHGIIENFWFDAKGQKVGCIQDPDITAAAEFSPSGAYQKGKSAKNILVDTTADQLMLADTNKKNVAIGISAKARMAIACAGRLGKAFWFDGKSGRFTTSKAYFEQLPDWIVRFNQEHTLCTPIPYRWQLVYAQDHPAYAHANKTEHELHRITEVINKNPLSKIYKALPESNKLVLDFAKVALQEHRQADNLLLYIGLTSLDKIGHLFGPDSYQYIDTIYHVDRYLKDFLEFVKTMAPAQLLICLTADHGNASKPEPLQEKGFPLAVRINTGQLKDEINQMIEKKYRIKELVLKVGCPSIFINQTKFKQCSEQTKKKLLKDLKSFFKKVPGIKNIWTQEELEKTCNNQDFIPYFQNQLRPGRSGLLQYLIYPYALTTKDETGSAHSSPYNYTTHVPLLLCTGKQKKRVNKPVTMVQLAPTIAKFFNIAKPSACLSFALPHSNIA